jgi:Mg-chelatase subunit ChlD
MSPAPVILTSCPSGAGRRSSTKTDPNYTALLLIVDRSGSMHTIRDDMVGGLTTMLAEQAAEPGRLTVDVVTFDDILEVQCTMATPDEVVIALEPRGMTALYDAVGVSVTRFGASLKALKENKRPDVVQVVVVTDGHENASSEYTASQVRALVTQQTEKYNWDFVYLGANQDAVLTGASMGFEADSAMTFDASSSEVDAMAVSLGRYVKDVRAKSKSGFTVAERVGAGPKG